MAESWRVRAADGPAGACLLGEYWVTGGVGVTRLALLDRPSLPSIICTSWQQRFRSTHDIEAGVDDRRL